MLQFASPEAYAAAKVASDLSRLGFSQSGGVWQSPAQRMNAERAAAAAVPGTIIDTAEQLSSVNAPTPQSAVNSPDLGGGRDWTTTDDATNPRTNASDSRQGSRQKTGKPKGRKKVVGKKGKLKGKAKKGVKAKGGKAGGGKKGVKPKPRAKGQKPKVSKAKKR